MNIKKPHTSSFTEKELAAALQIWNKAVISLMDIRHNLISSEEPLRGYRLPAHAFLFTLGGKGEVSLNNTTYSVGPFGLFHSSKGTELTITPSSDWLEYYLVLYKATEPPLLYKREYLRWMDQMNPFHRQFGFLPHNALFFSEELRKMYEKWIDPTPLNRFYVKSSFYRFAYEVYEALVQGQASIFEPNIIAVAKQYLDTHYNEPILIQELCQTLGVSYSHFHRSFKQQLGNAPQDYLIKVRLAAAKQWLENSTISIREIALHCGFSDEYSLYRLFTKNIGITPSAHREISHSNMIDNSIGKCGSFSYNKEHQVSVDILKEKGATHMLKQLRSKTILAATLSLICLLSACGTTPTNSSTGVAASPDKSQVSSLSQGTKIVSTQMGDVEIPISPERIVFFGMVGDLVAIGKMPIGGNADSRLYDGLLSEDSYTYVVIDDYESILSLSPDLILLSYTPEQTAYEKLSAIAPTVAVDKFQLTTRERIMHIGEIVGEEEGGAQALAQFDAQAKACREKLEAAGIKNKTITVMEGEYLFGDKFGRGADVVYNYLGFTAPKKLQQAFDNDALSVTVSMEVLSEYCGDYILRSVWDGSEDWSNNAVWNSIPAVANDHLIEINFEEYYSGDLYISAKLMNVLTDHLLS